MTMTLNAARLLTPDRVPLPGLTADAVVDLADRVGLRGRGGAGFPVGAKLRATRAGRRGRAIMVANAAEGEPASSKDATLLSIAPHLVLDGISLAARAVGATEAHLVVHSGSPAIAAISAALGERRDSVEVSLDVLPSGPRGYVASEESAIVQWLGGGPALPTFRLSRLAESGLRGRPTLVQNVETLAHLALAGRHGAAWFRSVGDPEEPGTSLVTVSGVVRNAGMYEHPTGTPVADILAVAGADDIAAVLTGGYQGRWIGPGAAAAARLSRSGMTAVGGRLGAGVLAVLPSSVCPLSESTRIVAWMAEQGAQQCGPCLNGLPAIAGALGQVTAGGAAGRSAVSRLQQWAELVRGRGACRHPDGVAEFVSSTLEVFADHVGQHLHLGPCRATAAVLPLPEPGAR